jgi:hypothetical protein
MGSMVIESTGPILGLSASAIAAFLASSTVLKSPVYVASKAGGMPGARFGKIADAEFHARKIKRQPPISNGRDTQQSRQSG